MADHAPAGGGYDDRFLGIPVPLPGPADGQPVRALTYPRFSVLLQPERQLALMTGVNIDGSTLRDLPRTGQWRLDPRVPVTEQAGPAVYADNDLDRGHLVRRRDPSWGTPAEARLGGEATFVYPNAAPQASRFNQSPQLWVGLEDHVLAYADATRQRLSVFTAPVLAAGDPPYRGIQIPRRFFKIAAWATAADGMPRPTASAANPPPAGLVLAAAGFVLDQTSLIDVREGVLAVPPLGGFRTFQVPIADIQTLAQVDLGELVDADVLPQTALRGEDAWRLLRVAADVYLG